MQEMIALWVALDPRIVYDGFSLQKDMADTYEAQSQACTITYLSSDKKPVAMTFDDMMRRLFKISFDPYHCIELRWGAEERSEEAATCRRHASGAQRAKMTEYRAWFHERRRPPRA